LGLFKENSLVCKNSPPKNQCWVILRFKKKPIEFGFQKSLQGPPDFLFYFKIMSKETCARFQNFEKKKFT